jgi:DNA-binding beta-propeller fold protein YncE
LPSHLAIDYASRTLYVANEGAESPGNTVSMIDTSVCNGHVTAGCVLAAPTVTTGAGPDGLTVDARTHTLYVSNGADSTVSVIDTAHCNSHVQTGCPSTSPTVRLAGASVGGVLDAATHSLFEPTSNSVAGGDAAGALSIIDTSTCNASVLAGCNQTPRQVPIGSGPIDAAENPITRRVYVVNEEDSDVSVVDIARCNAVHSDGCHRSSPTMSIGFNGGAVAVDTTTDTIYGSSQGRGTVTVLDGASCTDTRSSGCRHPAPTTAVGALAAGSTLVESTGTLYVANQRANTVSVIDTHACNSAHLVGCLGIP